MNKDKWNIENCGLAAHRHQEFYKTDGLLPYETRKGLLYETPNIELVNELLRRINGGEINLTAFIKYLQAKNE